MSVWLIVVFCLFACTIHHLSSICSISCNDDPSVSIDTKYSAIGSWHKHPRDLGLRWMWINKEKGENSIILNDSPFRQQELFHHCIVSRLQSFIKHEGILEVEHYKRIPIIPAIFNCLLSVFNLEDAPIGWKSSTRVIILKVTRIKMWN